MFFRLIRRLIVAGSIILLSTGMAPSQTPSPEAMRAAHDLVATLKLTDQYKALLPVILLGLKPVLIQGRPEIERDYDAMTAAVADAYTPYYNAMVDSAATLYANTFSLDELRQIEAFYRKPVGQKFLEKSDALRQQIVQIGQDTSRNAAEDLRTRLTELLRQKGHKF
jgi:hypothetical protein